MAKKIIFYWHVSCNLLAAVTFTWFIVSAILGESAAAESSTDFSRIAVAFSKNQTFKGCIYSIFT